MNIGGTTKNLLCQPHSIYHIRYAYSTALLCSTLLHRPGCLSRVFLSFQVWITGRSNSAIGFPCTMSKLSLWRFNVIKVWFLQYLQDGTFLGCKIAWIDRGEKITAFLNFLSLWYIQQYWFSVFRDKHTNGSSLNEKEAVVKCIRIFSALLFHDFGGCSY